MKAKLLVENWRRFLKESLNQSIPYDVGMVPMSAKPFHEGHMSLIRIASEECKKVIVFVSISDRKRKGEAIILGEDMKYIWENILEKNITNFYSNVEFEYGGSPVRKVYENLEKGMFPENIEKTYAIYTGLEDAGRYKEKYYAKMSSRVSIRTLSRGEDTAQISGTLMRYFLQNNMKEEFMKGLPSEIKNFKDREEIYSILKKDL